MIDYGTLLDESRCYACFGASFSDLLRLSLLRRYLLAISPNADVTVGSLLDYAKCYACFGASMTDLIELALLNKITESL